MNIFARIPVSDGTEVQIASIEFRGAQRFDIRQHWRPNGSDLLQPTRKGVSLPLQQLPVVRHALEQAEREALAAGLIGPADYAAAEVDYPLDLAGSPGTVITR